MRRVILSGLLSAIGGMLASAQVSLTPAGSSATPALWSGAAGPANSAGTNGDFYLNMSSLCLYGPKADGAWPSNCVSLNLGYVPENTSMKGAANGYAPLDQTGKVPLTSLPVIPSNQVTGAPNGNAGGDLGGQFPSPAVLKINGVALSGLGTGLLKNTTGSGTPSIAVANDVNAALGFTPENAANKGVAGGYASLDANSLVPLSFLPAIPYSQMSGVQAALGFTPENPANKGGVGGYAPLGPGTTTVPLSNLPLIPYSQTSGVQATLGFTAENAANKGIASGYAPLDSSSLVPLGNLPAIPYAQTSGVQPALGFKAENAANKGSANGYAPLDSGTQLPDANLPADAVTTGALAAGTLPVNVATLAAASAAIAGGETAAQLNTTGDLDAGGNVNATGNLAATSAGVASAGYSSCAGCSIVGTSGQTCLLTFSGGGATTNAQAALTLAGLNTLAGAAIAITAPGTGYTSAPTAGSLLVGGGNPASTCAGNPLMTSVLTQGCVHLGDGAGNDMGICAPAAGYSGLLNLPATSGTAAQLMTNDGAGNLQWTSTLGTAAQSSITQTGVLTGLSVSAASATGTIIFKAAASPTAAIQVWQDSGGTPRVSVTKDFNLTANVISGSGSPPGIACGAGAGTSPSVCTLAGNDVSGQINISPGSSPSASATLATITFATVHTVAPQGCLIQLIGAPMALTATPYISSAGEPSTTSWYITTGTTAPTTGANYHWTYICI